MDQCIYCKSTNLQKNIVLGQNAEIGAIGLEYKANLLLHGVEPLYADLCMDCGSIIRFHVENVTKKWVCQQNKKEV